MRVWQDKTPSKSGGFWPVVFRDEGGGWYRKHGEIQLDSVRICTALDQLVDSDRVMYYILRCVSKNQDLEV